MELIQKLGIDWRLLIGQIINFLILLFILYKFVYNPLLDILDKRQSKVEKSLVDAKKIEENLREAEIRKEKEILKAKKEAQTIIEKAKAAAENYRKETEQKTKEKIKTLIAESKEVIKDEKDKMFQSLRGEIADLVILTTKGMIGKELDQKKDKEIINIAIKDLSREIYEKD
ncbi:MAG TPA: F0F1 ATP synthase subunit B [Patescibacteria group bacterium]